jgi:hypothetical protein
MPRKSTPKLSIINKGSIACDVLGIIRKRERKAITNINIEKP